MRTSEFRVAFVKEMFARGYWETWSDDPETSILLQGYLAQDKNRDWYAKGLWSVWITGCGRKVRIEFTDHGNVEESVILERNEAGINTTCDLVIKNHKARIARSTSNIL